MTNWPLAKRFPVSRDGLVASKHPLASGVGAAILQAGGSAVDAAIATSFAAGVIEPYMSGLGGGGLAVYQPHAGNPTALHFGMSAPASADPAMYSLLPDRGDTTRFFWRLTAGDENVSGPRAVAIPGQVGGLRRLWELGGTMPWEDLLQPAIALAREGFPADWLFSLRALSAQELLARFPVTRATFLPRGRAPVPDLGLGAETVRQPKLADALELLAANPAALWLDPLAGSVVHAVEGRFTLDDLRQNRTLEGKPLHISFGEVDVCAVPWATGGPTAIEWLGILRELDPPADETSLDFWWAIVKAGDVALHDRLERLGDPEAIPFPAEILNPGYHRRAAEAIRAGEVGIPAVPAIPDSTTQLACVDRNGNAITITQTLLSLWGSGVTTESGILLNNGMMWFDPEPGHSNSIAAGKRPLANMCPLIVTKDGTPLLVFGASGGRKIVPAMIQILLRVALLGQSLADAIAAPRLDCTEQTIQADVRFGTAFCQGLAERLKRPVIMREAKLGASPWSSPVGLMRLPDGSWTGGADLYTMAEIE
jgi:gamma-glutamyltranspeptidase / glutathione hydrolase